MLLLTPVITTKQEAPATYVFDNSDILYIEKNTSLAYATGSKSSDGSCASGNSFQFYLTNSNGNNLKANLTGGLITGNKIQIAFDGDSTLVMEYDSEMKIVKKVFSTRADNDVWTVFNIPMTASASAKSNYPQTPTDHRQRNDVVAAGPDDYEEWKKQCEKNNGLINWNTMCDAFLELPTGDFLCEQNPTHISCTENIGKAINGAFDLLQAAIATYACSKSGQLDCSKDAYNKRNGINRYQNDLLRNTRCHFDYTIENYENCLCPSPEPCTNGCSYSRLDGSEQKDTPEYLCRSSSHSESAFIGNDVHGHYYFNHKFYRTVGYKPTKEN